MSFNSLFNKIIFNKLLPSVKFPANVPQFQLKLNAIPTPNGSVSPTLTYNISTTNQLCQLLMTIKFIVIMDFNFRINHHS